jgi:hypothetical protein
LTSTVLSGFLLIVAVIAELVFVGDLKIGFFVLIE